MGRGEKAWEIFSRAYQAVHKNHDLLPRVPPTLLSLTVQDSGRRLGKVSNVSM